MARKLDDLGLPRWLKPMNKVIVALQRRGLAIGTMRLLSVPGRNTGKLRTTLVSPLSVEDKRYIVAGLDGADWVKNVRAAGWGILAKGWEEERVALVELPVEERGTILRHFPHKVPHGVQFFKRLYGVSGDSDEFAALARRVSRIRGHTVERGRRWVSANVRIRLLYDGEEGADGRRGLVWLSYLWRRS